MNCAVRKGGCFPKVTIVPQLIPILSKYSTVCMAVEVKTLDVDEVDPLAKFLAVV
jgi:hypothetical protein